jgi:hypothetical protein
MTKTDIKAFKIIVDDKENRATLICVTYRIDTEGRYFGAEFYELVSSFDNSTFSIPYDRGASFQEELRVTARGYAVTPEYRKEIEKWIENKMKEAYGNTLKVTIEDCATQK